MKINSDTREYYTTCKNTYYEYIFNNNKIILHNASKIEVQVGKNNSKYTTKYTFDACDFGKAVFSYACINIGNGYKKRLYCDSLNKKVLHRFFS